MVIYVTVTINLNHTDGLSNEPSAKVMRHP